MTTNPLPEIKPSDLQAVRLFLTAERLDLIPSRPRRPRSTTTPAVVHQGITRARSRAAGRREA